MAAVESILASGPSGSEARTSNTGVVTPITAAVRLPTGTSGAIRDVISLIRQVAAFDSTALVLGGGGTNGPTNTYGEDTAGNLPQAKVITERNAITGSEAAGFTRNAAQRLEGLVPPNRLRHFKERR